MVKEIEPTGPNLLIYQAKMMMEVVESSRPQQHDSLIPAWVIFWGR
jgi:hypothetical protein